MPTKPWYHTTTIYQIYPRSFYDSSGDGIGDIPGIIQKLDYLKGLGFETLWCSPFFDSPQQDFGYDISNYTGIAPEYGTLEDARRLIEQVHRRGMRIVFDMVMNHTSSQHPWFKESRLSRDNPRADWYLWRDKPNNWQSVIGGNGWHYARERGQYYWASFLPFQPDLNYRNPEVKKTMFDVVRFWLDAGVDGFRLDIFNSIYKDPEYRDNPFSFQLLPKVDASSGFFQKTKYTVNLPESFHFAQELRSVCAEYGEKMLLGEVSGPREVIRKYLGSDKNDGLGLVFDFGMMDLRFNAAHFYGLIEDIEAKYPDPFMPVYVFSNHDTRRSIGRLGGDVGKAKLLQLLQFTVRGVPCLYNGEEIGMTDGKIPLRQALDPVPHKFGFIFGAFLDKLSWTINRDEVRTPMQWDGTKNAGFSSSLKSWLPVNPDYQTVNVENEERAAGSLLNTLRGLLKVRNQSPALSSGSLELVDRNKLPEPVLMLKRRSSDEEISVVMNFNKNECRFEFKENNWEEAFSLNANDKLSGGMISLDGFGGLILSRALQ
jgi:alpha-glucosidase